MQVTRRQFFGLSAAAAVGLSGCLPSSDPWVPPGPQRPRGPRTEQCAPAEYMGVFDTVGGVPLAYEDTGRQQGFRFDEPFHGQLDAWCASWVASTTVPPTQIRTYGAWIDGGDECGTSWHHAGRAFDIAGIDAADGGVSCREDQWRQLPRAELVAHRRRYWALAASVHLHFAYVLTYLYDDAHANHIHLDNGVSGSGMSSFQTRSRVQNQAVQAIARYLWDVPCEITGQWDRATQRATRAVLERLDINGALTRGDNWASYLAGSVARYE